MWNPQGGKISTRDLLQKYYTTIKVVRVPALPEGSTGRPNLINQQVVRLYNEIQVDCKQVQAKKKSLRMALNADRLQPYLQLAFDHFSSDKGLEEPFDFIKASFLTSPVSPDFAANIVRLGKVMQSNSEEHGKETLKLNHLLPKLTRVIASCVMLDSARHKRLGDESALMQEYQSFHEMALLNFCNEEPCLYDDCQNLMASHTKGHQNKKGNIIGKDSPEFQGTIDFETFKYKFTSAIKGDLAALLTESQKALSEGRDITAKLPLDAMRKFYDAEGDQGALMFVDHVGCFCCLMKAADVSLPCGHIVCIHCIQTYGEILDPTAAQIDKCPLHDHEPWASPRYITMKPALAGVRILSLDG
jgi:hypothetical protein